MAVFQIRMTSDKQKSLHQLEEYLCGYQNFEYVSRAEHSINNVQILLLTFEQTFIRANGTISLSVLLTEVDDRQTADLVASGGGEGWGFSGGSCRSFAKEAESILAELGFRNTEPEPPKNLVGRILDYLSD